MTGDMGFLSDFKVRVFPSGDAFISVKVEPEGPSFRAFWKVMSVQMMQGSVVAGSRLVASQAELEFLLTDIGILVDHQMDTVDSYSKLP